MDEIAQFSLHDELHIRLRKMIIAGQFKPGDKIPEKQLCEQFNVSRTPLREALKVLAAEGLIDLTPNRGALVAALTLEQFHECRPICRSLLSLCGELTNVHITAEEIRSAEAVMMRFEAAGKDKNPSTMEAASRELLAIIINGSRNLHFKSMLESVLFRIRWNKLISLAIEASPGALYGNHSRILAAMKAADGDALITALGDLVDQAYAACPEGRLPCQRDEDQQRHSS